MLGSAHHQGVLGFFERKILTISDILLCLQERFEVCNGNCSGLLLHWLP